MNLADVMDDLGDRIDLIDGLRVYRYPADQVQVPAAVISYPEDYTYDATYGRGTDRMTVPVIVMAGKVSDRASRDQLAAYANGSGDESIKQAIESGAFTAFDSARVMSSEFDVVSMAGIDYVAATFSVDVIGPGSEPPLVDYSSLNFFNPSDASLLSWTNDPANPRDGVAATNGTLYLSKLVVRGPAIIDTIHWAAASGGSGLTAGQNWVGLYGSDGTRLAQTEITTLPSGDKSTAITPVEAGPGFVWAAMLFNASGPPVIIRGGSSSIVNLGLTAVTYRYATAGTGLTTLPATITPATNAAAANAWWFALS